MMAFQYFKDQKVDIVSLETGLGGRLDATNIVDPLLSVITSIGLDHMDSLGPTIEHIASFICFICQNNCSLVEKAGIIKPKRPIVLGPHVPLDIMSVKAQQENAPLFYVEADQETKSDFDLENQKITR